MSRGSSRRLIPEPKSVAMSGSLLARAGRGLDRGDDVLMDRAGAALARIAADVRTREIQLVAQHVGEQRPRLHFGGPRGAVHLERNGALHDPGSRSGEGG